MHYDAPASDEPGNEAGATGLGIGAGPAGDSIGDVELPEFHPALDDDGRPVASRHGWEFVIQ